MPYSRLDACRDLVFTRLEQELGSGISRPMDVQTCCRRKALLGLGIAMQEQPRKKSGSSMQVFMAPRWRTIQANSNCISRIPSVKPRAFPQTTDPGMLALSSSSPWKELSSDFSACFAATCLDGCGAERQTRK